MFGAARTTERDMTMSIITIAAAVGGKKGTNTGQLLGYAGVKALFLLLGIRCHTADDAWEVITCSLIHQETSARDRSPLDTLRRDTEISPGLSFLTAAYITLTTVIYLSARGKLNVGVDTCLLLHAGYKRRALAASACSSARVGL